MWGIAPGRTHPRPDPPPCADTRSATARSCSRGWSATCRSASTSRSSIPGVGTARRPIAIRTARGDALVGPDNGLLMPAARDARWRSTRRTRSTTADLFLTRSRRPSMAATSSRRSARPSRRGRRRSRRSDRRSTAATLVDLDVPGAATVERRRSRPVVLLIDSFGNVAARGPTGGSRGCCRRRPETRTEVSGQRRVHRRRAGHRLAFDVRRGRPPVSRCSTRTPTTAGWPIVDEPGVGRRAVRPRRRHPAPHRGARPVTEPAPGPIVEVEGLTFRYRRATEPAIRDVSLTVSTRRGPARRRPVGLRQEHADPGDQRADPARLPGRADGHASGSTASPRPSSSCATSRGRSAPCSRTRPSRSSARRSRQSSRSGRRTWACPREEIRDRIREVAEQAGIEQLLGRETSGAVRRRAAAPRDRPGS